MRNLNQRELHGRNLRVDHATRDHGIDPKVKIKLQYSTQEFPRTIKLNNFIA